MGSDPNALGDAGEQSQAPKAKAQAATEAEAILMRKRCKDCGRKGTRRRKATVVVDVDEATGVLTFDKRNVRICDECLGQYEPLAISEDARALFSAGG